MPAGRSGDFLEIGSGTRQHAVEFRRGLREATWWPGAVLVFTPA